jgi:hypothetical protein
MILATATGLPRWPGAERAVPRHFVVFDSLCSGQKSGIKSRRALVFLHDLRAFSGNARDGGAGLSLGLLIDRGKYRSRRATWPSTAQNLKSWATTTTLLEMTQALANR